MLIFEIGLTNTHIKKDFPLVLNTYSKIKGISYDSFDIKVTKKRILFIIKNIKFTYFYNDGPIVSDKNCKIAQDFINNYEQIEFVEYNGKYKILSKIRGNINLINEYFLRVLHHIPSWNPILWILYLDDKKVIDFNYNGINSDCITYYDFYFEKPIVINTCDDYKIDDSDKYRSISTFDYKYLNILPIQAIQYVLEKESKCTIIDGTNKFFQDHSCSNHEYIAKRNSFVVDAKLKDILFWYEKDMEKDLKYYLDNMDLEHIQQSNNAKDIAIFIANSCKVNIEDIINSCLYIKACLSCFCVSYLPSLHIIMSYNIVKKEHFINDQVKNIILDIKDHNFRVKESLVTYIAITLEILKRNYIGQYASKDPFAIKKYFDEMVNIILSLGDFNFSFQDLKLIGFSDNFISFFVSRFNKIYINIKPYHKLNSIWLQHNNFLSMNKEDINKIVNLYKRVKNLSKKILFKHSFPDYNIFENIQEKLLLEIIAAKKTILDVVNASNDFIDNNIIFCPINTNRQLVILDIKQFLQDNCFLII